MTDIEKKNGSAVNQIFRLQMPKADKPVLIYTPGRSSLATSIIDHIKISETNKYLFFAQIQKQSVEVAVQPMTLPANFLEKNGVVKALPLNSGATNSTIKDSQEYSENCQPFLIFIKMGYQYRKGKKAITHLHYKLFDGKDLAVVVRKGDTFQKALQRDGRFLHDDKWKLYSEKHGADLFSNDLISDEYRNCSFECTYSTKQPKDALTKRSMSESSATRSEYKRKRLNRQSNNDPLCKDIYHHTISFKDPLFTVKVRKSMEEEAKERAFSMLLDPQKTTRGDKAVLTVAKKEFAKQVSSARPTWLLKPLSEAAKSVGCLRCGDVQGTCFLVKENMIITNFHVYGFIMEKRSSSSPLSHEKIKILFDYSTPNESAKLSGVEVDETSFRRSPIYSRKLDYIILPLKEADTLKNVDPLGSVVRKHVPRDGLVTIIGHPQGRQKLEETCTIVPDYLWRNELLKRCQDRRPPPVGFDRCLHICKRDIMSSNYEHRLPYDTSLFEGASGSPVFNMDGHIICLHTQGYRLEETSVMEFGVTFASIYEDIEERYGKNCARDLFPSIDGQCPMDTDE